MPNNFPSVSRRSFLQLSAAASSFTAFHAVTEPMLAWADVRTTPKNAVLINSNENPLGPCSAARDAVASMIPEGGRYHFDMSQRLIETIAKAEGIKPEYIEVFSGSSVPLRSAVLAYTSGNRSYVTADPGYEAGMLAAQVSGGRVVKVPLTKNHSHDVKAMLAAGPDAGLFYICTPNNPTGTLTSLSDIEYLVDNKPKGSVVMVDEAYIHFADAPSAIELVKQNKDVIVLRTFSKLYGMAGLRCGMAIARPELLSKIDDLGGWNPQPITAMAAAIASLNDPGLVTQRKRLNAQVRQETFNWLDRNGYTYIPSQSNCFMLDTKQDPKKLTEAMAAQNVVIGRVWPCMPTWVRITVGTRPEMDQFQAAFKKVMNGTAMGRLAVPRSHQHYDGVSSRFRSISG